MDIDQVACSIIANAGDSKSDSFAAIEAAQQGEFEKAENLLKTAMDKLLAAHEAHTEILFAEANEEKMDMKFILIHASNHLSVSEISREFAEVIVNLYREVKKK